MTKGYNYNTYRNLVVTFPYANCASDTRKFIENVCMFNIVSLSRQMYLFKHDETNICYEMSRLMYFALTLNGIIPSVFLWYKRRDIFLHYKWFPKRVYQSSAVIYVSIFRLQSPVPDNACIILQIRQFYFVFVYRAHFV